MPPKALALGRPVYRGYMPENLPQHRPRNPYKPWWKVIGKPHLTLYPKQDPQGFSDEPEYPPVNDATPEGLMRQVRIDWYNQIQALPTVHEKLHEINRQQEHYMAHLKNWPATANPLPMVKYTTRTLLINELPESYKQLDERGANLIRQSLLNQIALEKYESRKIRDKFISYSIRESNRSQHVQDSLVQNLVNHARLALAPNNNSQLLDYQLDLSPSIRSWWFHSGFKAPNNKVYYRSRKDADGKISQIIQCDGHSAVNIRGQHLIEPQLDLDHELVNNTSLIEDHVYPLKYYKAHYKFKNPVNLPGYWYDDKIKFDCPHTCFLTTDCLRLRNERIWNHAKPIDQVEDTLNSQAMMTAFSWLNGLSMYHGFTPFDEVQYPLTCQVITTDGQNWLFNLYQLNAHAFHRDLGGPKRNNICWSSGVMKLYDEYKGNFEFVGVNDQVLNLIARFFSQKTSPSYTESVNMRPYLNQTSRTEEELEQVKAKLRRTYEQRDNKYLKKEWKVPMFEHIYFRSPTCRNSLTHMKARWHIPIPKTPKIFE